MSDKLSPGGNSGKNNNASPRNLKVRTFRRWWVVLLCVATTVAVGGWGVGIYSRFSRPRLSIPEISLEGVQPEIVDAISAARQAVILSPRSGPAWGNLAMVLQAHLYEDQAAYCYDVAARWEPNNPTWPYLRGVLMSGGSGDHAAAIPFFERAANLSPPNSVFRLRLADALFEQNRLEEASHWYLEALAADNNDARALLGLGRLAVARKQYRDSLRFLRPIAENPLVQRRACALLANVYERLGEFAPASAERQRLAELPADSPHSDDPVIRIEQLEVGINARLTKAHALMRQDRLPEMIELLQETVGRYPQSDLAWENLGMALHKTGDVKGAENALQKSIEVAPKSASYHHTLGLILLSQKRYEEALNSFQKGVELRPTDPKCHFGLGECRRGLGDLEGAAEAYRTTLRYAPKHLEAYERLEALNREATP